MGPEALPFSFNAHSCENDQTMNGPPNYRMSARERLQLLSPNRGGQGDVPLVEVRHPFQGLQDNNYGNALFVQPGQSQLLLRAHGDDDMPHMFAISAGYTIQPEPTPAQELLGYDVSPYLVVKFGAGGANLEYELDFLSGMIFNVSGTSFDLEVHNPNNFQGRGPESLPIFAQASMGLGGSGRASSNPARRTVVVGDIAQNGTTVIRIPNGSVNFNILCYQPSLLAGLSVIQAINDPTFFPNGRIAGANNANFDTGLGAVPLMVGSRYLEITNTNGAQVNNVRAMFTIAF